MYEVKILGLDEGLGAIQAMLQEVKSKRDEYWQYAAFAVTDERGGLVCFAKMDTPNMVPLMLAMRKAYTSAIWARNTSELYETMKERPWSFQGNYGHDFTLVPGGVAILEPGQEKYRFRISIGAIGVSGAGPAAKDETVALVGLNYIKSILWGSK